MSVYTVLIMNSMLLSKSLHSEKNYMFLSERGLAKYPRPQINQMNVMVYFYRAIKKISTLVSSWAFARLSTAMAKKTLRSVSGYLWFQEKNDL